MTPQTLRQRLKQQRSELSAWQQLLNARRMKAHLQYHPYYRYAQHIALYLPIKGEADPRLLRHGLKSHQHIYLPTLAQRPSKHLQFIEWTLHTRWHINRFGIHEPLKGSARIRLPSQLDILIVPLVAFDLMGNRLGMGGGYYDRTFAFLNRTLRPLKPLLIGYAYNFQQVASLETRHWDIRLNAVCTEQGLRYF